MAITLYGEPNFVSPYVFSCFVTLTEKGVPFELRMLDSSKGETRSDDYLARTVTGRVPSLVHDEFAMAESSAIVEYLDEAFPERPVFPKDRHARARCRQLMSWLRSDDTAPIREERPTTSMFYVPAKKQLSPKAKTAAEKLARVAERLLPGGSAANLFGEWSIADAELAFMLERLILNDDPLPAPVRAWAEAQWKRPSVASWVDKDRPTM